MQYNIMDFGAYSSDKLMTEAIQKAIDTCYLQGGGEVVIPAGIFRTGDITLRSHVTLHLLTGAILEGSEHPEDYFHWQNDSIQPREIFEDPYHPTMRASATPFSAWSNGLIRIIEAEDVSIIGEPGSFIDGRNVFDPRGEEEYRGPHGINAWYVKDLTLKGYTLRNTGNWAHAIFKSSNIAVSNLTVLGGHDGIDLFLCEEAHIENCTFKTGDDCIAGFGSQHVTVKNCTLNSSCSAVRFGGTHVRIENCSTTSPCEYAFRKFIRQEDRNAGKMGTAQDDHQTKTAFLYYCDERFGKLSQDSGDIVFNNCSFKNINQIFNMDFGRHKWCCNAPLTSITFENCQFTDLKMPIYIHGDEQKPIDFTLKNVLISADENHCDMDFADIENYQCLRMENVQIEGFRQPTLIDRKPSLIESTHSTDVLRVQGTPGESSLKGH